MIELHHPHKGVAFNQRRFATRKNDGHPALRVSADTRSGHLRRVIFLLLFFVATGVATSMFVPTAENQAGKAGNIPDWHGNVARSGR